MPAYREMRGRGTHTLKQHMGELPSEDMNNLPEKGGGAAPQPFPGGEKPRRRKSHLSLARGLLSPRHRDTWGHHNPDMSEKWPEKSCCQDTCGTHTGAAASVSSQPGRQESSSVFKNSKMTRPRQECPRYEETQGHKIYPNDVSSPVE